MNGIEAAIEICKLLDECKVVLVSGHNDSWALLQGAHSRGYKFEILAKPVHPLILFQTPGDLREFLERSERPRIPPETFKQIH